MFNTDFENDFNVLYENNSTSNYLVLRTGIDKALINYQTQMLLNNKINGLLGFNINYIGDVLNCFYNVTSKCTLDSFMSRKRFSRNEFLITILNIINNIFQLKNYLLYDNNILLDEKFIYVEPESIDIYFVYLPFLECKNDIKAFFLNLIVKLVKFLEEDSDNYIQKILEAIKDDLFNLSNLKSLIENLLGEDIRNQNLNSWRVDSNINSEDKEIGFKINEKLKIEKAKPDSLKTWKTNENKAAISKGNIRIPSSLNIKNQEQKAKYYKSEHHKEAIEQNKKFNLYLLSLISLQVFLLVTFILIVNSNFVKMSDNPKNTIVILLLIFLSVDILLLRIIKEKSKKTDETSKYEPLQFIINKMNSNINNKDDKLPGISKDKQENQISITDENYSGETVILKKSRSTEQPYLKEKDGEEIIEIDKKSLLIGRMESFVDYIINSTAVGKIHAEILAEGDNFYVMDCNSRNGTFLNDCRIVPNTKNKVCNNDILRFANKEFMFICPEKPIRSII